MHEKEKGSLGSLRPSISVRLNWGEGGGVLRFHMLMMNGLGIVGSLLIGEA